MMPVLNISDFRYNDGIITVWYWENVVFHGECEVMKERQ